MATNNIARYGFRWAGSVAGGDTPPPIEQAFIATNYRPYPGSVAYTGLHVGDPLAKHTDGSLILSTAGSAGRIDYILAGVERYYDGTKMVTNTYLPDAAGTWTTTDRQTKVLVIPAAAGIWEIDSDDAVTFTTRLTYEDAIGENADISYSATTSGAFPRLDISTNNTTSTLQCCIKGISDTPENIDYAGSYVKLLVTINVTAMPPYATGGTGI